MVKGGPSYKPISIIGLTDFHGQLDPTTLPFDGVNSPVGGAANLATMFDEEFANLPGPGLLLASGDNVGASPANSGLLEDMPAIDVENAWGLDATSLGNHEFDYGIDRLKAHIERAQFPFLASNVVETATGEIPDWLDGASKVFSVNGIKVGVIGAELKETPELVSAGATAGLTFLGEGPRIKAESNRLRALGVRVQVVVIHQGTSTGTNAVGNTPGTAWTGPILAIADQLQDTTVDAMLVGPHPPHLQPPVREVPDPGGLQRRGQLLGAPADGQGRRRPWAGGATRVAKTIGVTGRADVKAIVDEANAQTAVLRNQVIGTQQFDIKRAPTRLFESAMGNMVADAMREKYPGVDAALTNSGGLRADLNCSPAQRGRAGVRDHLGRDVLGPAVRQPDGDRDAHRRAARAGVPQRLLAGLQPAFAGGTGRFPQVSGMRVTYTCDGACSRSSPACGRRRPAWADPRRPSRRRTRSAS